MSRRNTAVLILITLVCGIGAFFASRTVASAGDEVSDMSLCQCLTGETCEITDIEEEFREKIQQLSFGLKDHRKELAEIIDDAGSDPKSIKQKSEAVIIAQENLIRSVGEHIITLRGKLSHEQKEHLMRLCANSVRGPMRRRNGHASGQGNGRQRRMRLAINTDGTQGEAHGMGRGNGMCGQGRGWRLAAKLELTQGQIDEVNQLDPEFDNRCRIYCDDIAAKRSELLDAFENKDTSDDLIMQKVEDMIKAQTALERRVIEHILIVRPSLTDQQQGTLVGLCGNCPRN